MEKTIEERLLDAAKKYFRLRGFEVPYEDKLVYKDEDGDLHICIQVQGWDEDDLDWVRPQFEKVMVTLEDPDFTEGPIYCDLLMWKVFGEQQAMLKHVKCWPLH